MAALGVLKGAALPLKPLFEFLAVHGKTVYKYVYRVKPKDHINVYPGNWWTAGILASPLPTLSLYALQNMEESRKRDQGTGNLHKPTPLS